VSVFVVDEEMVRLGLWNCVILMIGFLSLFLFCFILLYCCFLCRRGAFDGLLDLSMGGEVECIFVVRLGLWNCLGTFWSYLEAWVMFFFFLIYMFKFTKDIWVPFRVSTSVSKVSCQGGQGEGV